MSSSCAVQAMPFKTHYIIIKFNKFKFKSLLSSLQGDIIGIIKKVDENWFEGILGGQYGIFPLNFVQLNKAGRDVMGLENSSSGSGSSSDEDSDGKRKRTSRRGLRSTHKKRTSSPWVKVEQTDDQSKRHTIHIENPDEQKRDSRRALNLSDDQEQPPRPRTQSQGRRSSETAVQVLMIIYQIHTLEIICF